MGRPVLNKVGKRFERLTVIEAVPTSNGLRPVWLCKCDCGKTKPISSEHLKTNGVKSCGCLRDGLRGPDIPTKTRATRILLRRYKYNAKKAGKGFDLSEDSFEKLIQMPCFYCEQPPAAIQKQPLFGKYVDLGFRYTGIDRVNNSVGYTMDNVRPCCAACNSSKLDRTEQEFRNWLERLYKGGWYGERN